MAIKSVQYDQVTYNISYEIVNPSAKMDIVFLHGWGSNKEIMRNAFKDDLKSFSSHLHRSFLDLENNHLCKNHWRSGKL